jgi:hypothetical protein
MLKGGCVRAVKVMKIEVEVEAALEEDSAVYINMNKLWVEHGTVIIEAHCIVILRMNRAVINGVGTLNCDRKRSVWECRSNCAWWFWWFWWRRRRSDGRCGQREGGGIGGLTWGT